MVVIATITAFCVVRYLSENDFDKYLITPPQQISVSNDCMSIDVELATRLFNEFPTIHDDKTADLNYVDLQIIIDPAQLQDQGYTLTTSPGHVELIGHDPAGLFYGKQTLTQLLDYARTERVPLPCVQITDWPNFERRGYMLDISRDKVPTMESLFQLIDLLAQLKINEFQLYTEHTFAYTEHQQVWENASPITASEIRLLDEYCRERFIDLVPNQNSFGHMENWLKHEDYLHLAECPTDCNTEWGKSKQTCLDPTNPQSFELMQDLYAELLPNFSSKRFNIGGDETAELCNGRSKSACNKIGKGQVYLEYIKKLNTEANKHGHTCQIWGDVLLEHPEIIEDIPKNMTIMVWGYKDSHPFKDELSELEDLELDLYVCPGTSTWRSEIGRNENAFDNLERAAKAGKSYDVTGFLNTNWGDYGHFQPLSVVYPSLIIGASYSWNYNWRALDHLEFQLSHYIFKDTTSNFARALLKLGNAYLKADIPNGNSNANHLMLRRYKWTMEGHGQTKEMTVDGLAANKDEILEALDILDRSKPTSNDPIILLQETRQAALLAIHGLDLGIARLKAKDHATGNISPEAKARLISDLSALIENHKKLWVVRNRVGGLNRSASKLEDLLNYYRSGQDVELRDQ